MNEPILILPNPIISKRGFALSTFCLRQKSDMHIHNYVHIWYALAGKCVHTIGDDVYIQTPGTCVAIPPHMPHCIDTTVSDETPVILSITFKDNFLTSRGYNFCSYSDRRIIFARYQIPFFYGFPETERAHADELARNMISEFSEYSSSILDELAGMLASFLRLMCVKCEAPRPTEIFIENASRIDAAIKFMEEHYSKRISLADLCKFTALSHYSFTKKFKEITGLTAMEYIHLLRLTRARHLLIFTDKSLSKIAEAVGFYDKSRLIHAFREYTELSPSKFREQERPKSFQEDFNTKKKRDYLRELDRNAGM